MSDPVEEMAAAAAAGYLPGSPSEHHDDNSHHHHDVDVDVDHEEHTHNGEAEGEGDGDADGEDAAANSKWSRNGFGAAVPKQVGKFSKDESEGVRKAVEEYCAAKQISTARLCSECDHKVRVDCYISDTGNCIYLVSFMLSCSYRNVITKLTLKRLSLSQPSLNTSG